MKADCKEQFSVVLEVMNPCLSESQMFFLVKGKKMRKETMIICRLQSRFIIKSKVHTFTKKKMKKKYLSRLGFEPGAYQI